MHAKRVSQAIFLFYTPLYSQYSESIIVAYSAEAKFTFGKE